MNESATRPRASRLTAFAACAVIFAALYGQYLIGFSPAGGDTVNQYLPYQELIREATRRGHWPLWNSMTFCGRPLMGDIQVGVLYPPNWLHWWIPLPISFALVLALHGAWMAWGCWRLARRFGLAPPAAALGAALFVASPFFTLHMQPGIILFIYVGAWWPWLALCAARLVERPCFARTAALAGAIAMSLLAGSPQLTYYGWLLTIALVLVLPGAGGLRGRLPQVLWMGLAFALAAGLAASQIMQTAGFIGSSFERGSGASWEYVTDGSFAPRLLWLMLNPGYLGVGWDSGVYWGGRLDFGESCDYLPLWVPAILAPLALAWLWRNRASEDSQPLRRIGWLVLGTGLLALALAPGADSPLFKLFFYCVPGFNRFRVPARLMFVYLTSLCVLAALAYDRLLRGAISARAARIAAGCGAAAALAALAGSYLGRGAVWAALGSPAVDSRIPAEMASLFANHAAAMAMRGAMFTLAAAALLCLPLRRAAWAAPALALAELVWLGAPSRADTRIAAYGSTHYPRTELVKLLEETRRGGRVLWLDDVPGYVDDQNEMEVYPNRLAMQHIPDARGYDPVNARWMGEWMNLLAGRDPRTNPHGLMFVGEIARPAWLTPMGVSVVLTYRDLSKIPGLSLAGKLHFAEGDGDLKIWRNDGFRGMAFAAPRPAVAAGAGWRESLYESSRLALDPAAGSLGTLVVSGADAAEVAGLAPKIDERFDIRQRGNTPNMFHYGVEYPEPGLLYLAQSAYDGWTVRVDGKAAEPLVVSGVFLAVAVPKGEHDILFIYQPRGFTPGNIICMATLALLAYGLLRPLLARRPAPAVWTA